MKFKLSFFIDGLFIALFSFIASLAFCLYFINENAISVILSICFCLIVTSFYALKCRKKMNKNILKKSEQVRYENCVHFLCLSKKQQVLDFIFKFFNEEKEGCELRAFGIICEDKFIYPIFTYEKVEISDIVKAYKRTPKNKKTCVLAIDFSQDTTLFCQNFDKIELLTLSQIFPKILKGNFDPQLDFSIKKTKLKFRDLLISTFEKKRAGKYALYGVVMLILSNFVFYPIWYILCGSLFLIYSVSVKFFAKN